MDIQSENLAFADTAEPYDKEELEGLVRRYLDLAVSDELKPTERAKRWRKFIAMQPPSEEDKPWDGAPGITTPIVRQKVDGVRAHIQASLDQDPMFVLDPRQAKESQVKSAVEERMKLSIEQTDSRVEILRAVRDAIEVGTGHLKHVVFRDVTGNYEVASRYVPFEDIFVYPSRRTRTNSINYFERYFESRHIIRTNADAGIYDAEAVDQLLKQYSEDQMNEVEELWEAWVWYKGKVWEVRYHKTIGILAARPSVWFDVMARAPYDPIYIEPSQTSYWGDSIPQILEGLQQVSDTAFNVELAQAQRKINPPILVRQSSPVYSYIRKHRQMAPGTIIPASGDPRLDIYVPLEQMNPFSTQLLGLANQLAEEATFSDMLVPGTPVGGSRKTATEVNILASVGNLKLTNYYRNVVFSLEKHANAKWKLIVEYSDVLFNVPEAKSLKFKVNGKESTTERQMRLQRLQALLNPAFMQMVTASAQSPFVETLVRALIEELDLPLVKEAFKNAVEQTRMGMAQQTQQGQLAALLGGAGGVGAGGQGRGPVR